ncbi:MAG: selenocysteine-specific translation elongation factor [Syntrophomonadaceae bacterium]|nr:selenocysteine-specific translation elongation factor [Syntrophomonadaceae bacterium]
MKRLIIGTAGHIDHGKTTLVRALTGIDTDRLKEEKQRGISIELGFAHFTLPSGQKAAIVDVPGHERFIRHMLAGASGIDMVVFTIAADEGVMPQTREHMDIIELLGVNKGIVVLTKKDLVDEEWLILVEEEVRDFIDKGILKGAPIIAVSAFSGEGIEELVANIERLAEEVEEKPAFGQARFPIDRVFTIAGFGTVVTGTLWSGQISVGDTLELMPERRLVRVRNLQVHNEKVSDAYAGQRVAVNLQGIEVADIKRGYLLVTPGYLSPSYRVDTRLRLLQSSPRNLRNWNRIRFHLGTDEALGRIVLLDRDELRVGEEAFAQIVMEKPVVCCKGDPFVIRFYSPVTTIGGGTIIDPNAPKQKRFKEDVLHELMVKEEGDLNEVVQHELMSNPKEVVSLVELAKKTGSSEEQVKKEINQLIQEKKAVEIKKEEYISYYGLELISKKISGTLAEYHQKYPLRDGYPKEDMRSRFFPDINGKIFNFILKELEDNGVLVNRDNKLKLPEYSPAPNEKEKEAISQIVGLMNENLFSPPSLEEVKRKLSLKDDTLQEIMNYLTDQGVIIKVTQDMYFSKKAIEEGKERLEKFFAFEKELSLATARDIFNTTRKYALPLVEYYDKIRFTRRVGDMRVKV